MNLQYVYVESTVKPVVIEASDDTIYLRTAITETKRINDESQETMYWQYQEAKMTFDEFNKYANLLNANNLEQILSGNNDLVVQSTNIAVNTEYLVCLAEIGV